MSDFFDQSFSHLKNNQKFHDRLKIISEISKKEKEILKKITFKKKTPHLFTLKEDQATLVFKSSQANDNELLNSFEILKPWKKGPFEVNKMIIDGEWRSDIKWNKIISQVKIKGKRILDIGANNGYYMFRALLENPSLILGIDPTFRYWAQYCLLKQMILDKRIMYYRLGHQDLHFFTKQFDIVLCLGIIYHATDPITLLKKIHQSLETGGYLILESQGIPGENPVVLIPKGKYAGASGMWCIPTPLALKHWLIRTGFSEVEIFHTHVLDSVEQRQTKWAEGASLKDFLDASNPSKTIEGYPAPIRIYLKAKK